MFVTKIWRSLTFNIVQAIYPLIPSVYKIFQDLAEYSFITQDDVKKISGNIYIIISVCMLFTMGIKLISTIVNPDLMNDKKKGFKQVFFRSIASMFLIVLVPLGFNKAYQAQEYVMKEHLVEKIILGIEVTDDSDPGQVLAGYLFESFCMPNKEVSVESLSNSGADAFNRAVTKDIDAIDELDDAINSRTNGNWDLQYNPILSPLAGIFVLYQLVVMCIDIALRSVKLGLLQLLTPVILCGYIVSGTDLLQKWFKEVMTTFMLLFIKVATISFVIYGLSLMPDFFKKNAIDGNFLYRGIIRTFIIIGLLILIKKLPEVLNSILGTKFEYRGGIRGRLGEMAGVGQLAQKAWDKVRVAGAKLGGVGLAVAGLGVPGALAAGGLGFGLHRGWNKGFRRKKPDGTVERNPWKESKIGMGLRRFGAGAKAVGTGLTTKGGIIKGIETGVESYKNSDILKSGDMIRKKKGQVYDAYGIGADNRVAAVSQLPVSQKRERTAAAYRSEARADKETAKILSQGKYSAVAQQMNKTREALRAKIMGEVANSKYDALRSTLDSISANVTDDKTRDLVDILKSDFVTGGISAEEATNRLARIIGPGNGNVGKFRADAEKFERELQNEITVWKVDEATGATYKEVMTLGEKLGRTANGGFNISTIGDEYKSLNTTYDNFKNRLDNIMESEKYNEEQKAVINAALDSSEIVYKSVADTTATYNGAAVYVNPDGSQLMKTNQAAGFGTGLAGAPVTPNPATASSTGSSSGTSGSTGTGGGSAPAPASGGPSAPASGSAPSSGGSSGSTPTPAPANGGTSAPASGSASSSGGSDTSGSSGSTPSGDGSGNGGNTIINNYYNNGGNGGSGGTIKAELDSTKLEGKLDDVSKAINTGSESVVREINKQGIAVNTKLNTINQSINDVGDNVNDIADTINEQNKDK